MEEKKEIGNEETDEILEKRKEIVKNKFLNWLKNPYDRALFCTANCSFYNQALDFL